MALIEFKNKPNTETPINDDNLNHNFRELETKFYKRIIESGTNLNDYIETGTYFFKSSDVTPVNIPAGSNGWLVVLKGDSGNIIKQIWYRFGSAGNHFQTFVRTRFNETTWGEWKRLISEDELYYKDGDTYKTSATLGGMLTSSGGKVETTIFTNKSLSKINSIIVNDFTFYVRKDNGGYLIQATKDEFVADKGGEFKATKAGDNAVTIAFFGTYNNPLNNTPVGIELANLQLTFKE